MKIGRRAFLAAMPAVVVLGPKLADVLSVESQAQRELREAVARYGFSLEELPKAWGRISEVRVVFNEPLTPEQLLGCHHYLAGKYGVGIWPDEVSGRHLVSTHGHEPQLVQGHEAAL